MHSIAIDWHRLRCEPEQLPINCLHSNQPFIQRSIQPQLFKRVVGVWLHAEKGGDRTILTLHSTRHVHCGLYTVQGAYTITVGIWANTISNSHTHTQRCYVEIHSHFNFNRHKWGCLTIMADIELNLMLPWVMAVYLCLNSGGLTPVLGLTLLVVPSSGPPVFMNVAISSTLMEADRMEYHRLVAIIEELDDERTT